MLAIPVAGVPRVWHVAGPFLAKGAALTAKLEIRDVPAMLAEGRVQLWLAWDSDDQEILGAALTDLSSYFSGWKTARVILMGGMDLERWLHLIGGIEIWASEEGCDALEVVGRKGWERLLPEYAPIEHVYSKPLPSGREH